MASTKVMFVTGGTSGIGLALCKQLAVDHNCRVVFTARSQEKGHAARDEINSTQPDVPAEFVICDTSDDASVKAAVGEVEKLIGTTKLDAIINNAGIGGALAVSDEETVNTNMLGPKRVIDSFLPLLDDSGKGRIVNVGSGAGPGFCAKYEDEEFRTALTSWENRPLPFETYSSLWNKLKANTDWPSGMMREYGFSKAALTAYTMDLASIHKDTYRINCLSPGFIDTKLTAGFGAKLTPEQGTASILHCLFKTECTGLFFGSDAKRSPLIGMRDPGSPEFQGDATDPD